MPANLPPQYSKAEDEFRKASTPAERLEKLREMFRLLPKHKGTEKLQSDLKQKISRAKDDLEGAKAGAKKAGVGHRVPKEGAGQVVLVGAPNVGKSALLAALTNAHPEVAAYPYTTRAPYPGMMAWEDVRVQLVDLPAVDADFMEPWVPGLIRSADAALLVADLASDEVADAVEAVLRRLSESHTELVRDLPFDAEDEAIQHVKTILIAAKSDAEGADDRLEIVREWLGARFPVIAVSGQNTGKKSRRATSRRLRCPRCDEDLHQDPRQARGPRPPVHTADRERGSRLCAQGWCTATWSSQLRSAKDLGLGHIRRSDGAAGSHEAQGRGRGRAARVKGSGR